MRAFILSLSMFLSLVSSQNTWAMPFGPADIGVKSADGSMLLPFCGKYSYSRATHVKVCMGDSFDVFTLPEGNRITVYGNVLKYWNPQSLDDLVQTTYADGKGKFLLISNRGAFNEAFDADKVDLQTEVRIQEFDLQEVRSDGSFEGSEVVTLPAKYCLQAFYTSDTRVALVCGDDTSILLFELNPNRSTGHLKTQLLTAAEANVEKGYLMVPNFKYDPVQKRLVNDLPSENLGNGMRTPPRGYIDLEKKAFVFE